MRDHTKEKGRNVWIYITINVTKDFKQKKTYMQRVRYPEDTLSWANHADVD